MIRREIQFSGEPTHWWLVSQVEHARLSGLLADQCTSHLPESVRSQLLQAIVHHDDGWAAWDANPQLDENGRPISFRELPLEMSLPIWSASIEAAAEIDCFTAWVVAGHFLALLRNSDKEATRVSGEWRADFQSRSDEWFAEWQMANPAKHTENLATEGLRWLQLFDVMSLWLCSACPGEGEQVTAVPETYHIWEGEQLETKLSYASACPCIEPWLFAGSSMFAEAEGWIVPIHEYASTQELLVQRKPHTVHWQLQAEV